jgi:hypothetical protein
MTRWLVPAFVVWHLAFLAFRNPVSLWQDAFDAWVARTRGKGPAAQVLASALDRTDRAFIAYEHALALDQGWRMFAAPLARTAPFPAVIVRFEDGGELELRSENEPAAPDRFVWREGRTRLRKHEAQIVSSELERYGLSEYWSRYLLWKCRRWRDAHPHDARPVRELVLIRRRYMLPEPGQPITYGEPSLEHVGSMSGASCNR